MTSIVSLGLLLLRLIAGLTLAAHGARILFGWFGGPGFASSSQVMQKLGFKPAWFWTSLTVLGEVGGGLSLAFGFLTPLGAAGMFGAMFMAIAKEHWKNGFWNGKGGYEFPLQLLASSLAIGLAGPGNYSLDALFGINIPTSLLFGVLAAAALVVDLIGLALSRTKASGATPASTDALARPVS